MSVADVLGLIIGGLAIGLAVPGWYLAMKSVRSERAAQLAAHEAAQLRKITEHVAEQLKPRNGKTVANSVEDTNDIASRLETKWRYLDEKLEEHLVFSDSVVEALNVNGIKIKPERKIK